MCTQRQHPQIISIVFSVPGKADVTHSSSGTRIEESGDIFIQAHLDNVRADDGRPKCRSRPPGIPRSVKREVGVADRVTRTYGEMLSITSFGSSMIAKS